MKREETEKSRQTPPALLQGSLSKKSGNDWFGLKGWDERYVVLKEQKLSYWKSESAMKEDPKAEAQGVLNLATTACEILPHHGNSTLFSIRPKGGKWIDGAFTGADAGREFVFDAAKSEHSRSEWVEALTAHIEYAHGVKEKRTRIKKAFTREIG